jgi:hypothetical protein
MSGVLRGDRRLRVENRQLATNEVRNQLPHNFRWCGRARAAVPYVTTVRTGRTPQRYVAKE